jgi:long-chain-fatty-acid--CoA ligase ACSBG
VLLGKVRVALGLDRCFACYVSAAPIEVKILEYFASIDVPILELFGQSECSGPHATNSASAWKIGTVGRSLPGTETKLDPDNGELVYSGRHIFAGYLHMDDKTKEAIDPDGFLHSGDVVSIDDCLQDGKPGTGFIHITGRIKELIITAGGENVPPVLIEEQMKEAMPALSNCMTIGDKRKFLTILFCLQVEIDEETGIPTTKLAGHALDTSKEIGSSATTTVEVKECAKWKKYFDEGMAVANGKAASRAQNVGKWSLLPTDFSEPGGELTPTLKLKRSVAADKYSAEIEALYA